MAKAANKNHGAVTRARRKPLPPKPSKAENVRYSQLSLVRSGRPLPTGGLSDLLTLVTGLFQVPLRVLLASTT